MTVLPIVVPLKLLYFSIITYRLCNINEPAASLPILMYAIQRSRTCPPDSRKVDARLGIVASRSWRTQPKETWKTSHREQGYKIILYINGVKGDVK